jgi:hypothetical protein
MDRREALQLLMGGAALQLASPHLFAKLREARVLLETQTVPRTLDPHQNATVTAIAEMIIPKTETSGATEVDASQFIDLILTEWYTEEERNRFLHGLTDIDVWTQTSFGKQFVECSPPQRTQILTELGKQMMEDADTARHSVKGYRGSPPGPNKNFYYMVRSLTLTAYYTSEEGADKQPGVEVTPNR